MTVRARRLFSIALLAGIAGALVGCGSSGSPRLSGSAILAVADGDMVGTVFADGLLYGRDGDQSLQEADMLTIVALPLPEPGESGATARFAQLEAPNSVLGAPRSVAVSRDGRFALVLETRARAPEGSRSMGDLAPSGRVSLVDLSDALSPRIAAGLDLGRGVTTISLHPGGGLAAALRNTADGPTVDFIEVGPENLTLIGSSALQNIEAGPQVGAGTVAFSPTGDALAVTVLGHDVVALYRVERTSESPALWPWGDPVSVGNFPYVGSWTPNGKFFVTSDLMWGDARTHDIENAPAGSVSVVGVDENGAHGRVGSAFVGVSPEGMTISPQGDLIVTGNIEQSFRYEDDPRYTHGGTLSLLSMNPETGELTLVGGAPTGAAPQGMAFDTSGEHLLVTDFEGGAVQVWRVKRGDRPGLEFTGVRVGAGRGVHAVHVLP